MLSRDGMRRLLFAAALMFGTASHAMAGDDRVWSIRKTSGEVWLASEGAQQISLQQEETLRPGDTIRTGRNGRVLLVRGEETILISPNSVVGLPVDKRDGLSTTIVQQAGSILLEVEKRNVKHFEVETPYLAAVVKGTQFSVTVAKGVSKVGVFRGQVEVSDFKTGQIAQVMPGQTATVAEGAKTGLTLSGSGTFNPIEQGKPRASGVERVPVPKSGLSTPRNAANGHSFHALARPDGSAGKPVGSQPHGASAGVGVVHISSSLGEVKLNFQKVTHGLAHAASSSVSARSSTANADTAWGQNKSAASAGSATPNSDGPTAPGSNSSSGIATAGQNAGVGNGKNGGGNGSNGNGYGSGNAYAYGLGNGNAGGNGNGNPGGNGNGNGAGNGHGHHP